VSCLAAFTNGLFTVFRFVLLVSSSLAFATLLALSLLRMQPANIFCGLHRLRSPMESDALGVVPLGVLLRTGGSQSSILIAQDAPTLCTAVDYGASPGSDERASHVSPRLELLYLFIFKVVVTRQVEHSQAHGRVLLLD